MHMTNGMMKMMSGKKSKDRLQDIFEKQIELEKVYSLIEEKNGCPKVDINFDSLDSRLRQLKIKDIAFRFIEEYAEFMDAETVEEKKFELIDCMHCLVQLTIFSGFVSNDIITGLSILHADTAVLVHWHDKDFFDAIEEFYDVVCKKITDGSSYYKNRYSLEGLIKYLGLMCHCLKNKPWKNTEEKTKENRYFYYLLKVWSVYMFLMMDYFFSPDDIYNIYLYKYNLNKKRQQEGY